MTRREQGLNAALAELNHRTVLQAEFRWTWQKANVLFTNADNGPHLALDLTETQEVVLVAVGDQNGSDMNVADFPKQLFRLCWGVDDYPLVGFWANQGA